MVNLQLHSVYCHFSQNALCTPLPIPQQGQSYALGLLVVKLGLLVLTAAGQLLVYASMRRSSPAAQGDPSPRVLRSQRLARPFFAIVLLDFLCW